MSVISIFLRRFLEVSWRRCHCSSGFSPSRFVLFLYVIPDRLDAEEIRSMCGALAVDSLCKQGTYYIRIYFIKTNLNQPITNRDQQVPLRFPLKPIQFSL